MTYKINIEQVVITVLYSIYHDETYVWVKTPIFYSTVKQNT